MIRLECDYNQGAHPKILEALLKTNDEQTCGYGLDPHCMNAKALIQQACGVLDADVHFLVGGTQANATVISSVLRAHQGALSPDTGHINVHETGAVEGTGHKVLTLPNVDGKITGAQVDEYITLHYADANAEHTIQPGLVYISFPTESGTLYSKKELMELYAACQKHDVPLFIDGARLGYGLQSPANDLTLEEIAKYSDIFYIGGTKCGALFGEAVVITNDKYKKDFRYYIKHHGGMLAKGRFLGIQFETLFTDNLYNEISKNAITQAMKLKNALVDNGYELMADSYTNQQFVYLKEEQSKYLEERYALTYWGKVNGKDAYRICTSWSTSDEVMDQLIGDIIEVK